MRILFIVPYVPNLIRVRPYNLIRHLAARGHEVTVLTLWSNQEERADAEALKEHCHRVVALPLPHWRSLWNCLRALPTRIPLQAVYCWQPALARRLDFEIQNSKFEIAHIEHLRGANYGLRTKDLGLPTVWDSVDCISYLFEQAARDSRSFFGSWITRLELPRTRRYEGWLVRQFDRVLVTSDVDKQALQHLASRFTHHASRIAVLPNGVDLNYFTPADEPRDPATLVITGKMSYHANVTAVLHLVNDIMPHVWAQRPNVDVWIVGKDPSREIRSLATDSGRLTITGTVPDIRPYLRRATLAVAPMPYGAGIQNKVLEAMACGTPVVATSQAVSALDARPGEDLLVGDEAEPFARAVLRLLGDADLRAGLGAAGRRYVEVHHDWRGIAEKLEGIYEETIEYATRDTRSAICHMPIGGDN